MKNILVIGANGMLGGEAVDYFNNIDGYCAKGLSRSSEFNFKETVIRHLTNGAYDWCVNCAAMTDTAGAETIPQKRLQSLEANVMLPAEIAKSCHDNGVRLLHFSTDYAFGGEPADSPIPDTARPSPISVYGTHKVLGETEALAINPGATAVLRTSWLYGRRNEKSFVHRFSRALASALAEGRRLEVPDDEVSLPTSVGSLLRMAKLVIDRDMNGIMHAVSRGRADLLPSNQVPSRWRWAHAIGSTMRIEWEKRKSKNETTEAEDLIWEKYGKIQSIVKKPGGKTDEWRPKYSAMLVSENLQSVSTDWIDDLDRFLGDKYCAEWSRRICAEASVQSSKPF